MRPLGVVAIVDDDPTVLESLGDMLLSRGLVVRAFSLPSMLLKPGGLEGVDLLVTDVRMPEMDGFALKQQARAQRPELPVIFITAESGVGDGVRNSHFGDSTVFRKPFSAEDLYQVIADLLPKAA